MRRAGAAGLLLVVVLASCGRDRAGDTDWAAEAEALVTSMEAAYDSSDAYRTARFFSAGGTLDLTAWDLGVATNPAEVVRTVESLWFSEPGRAEVTAEHLFVSPDGAIVWWHASDASTSQTWAQSYVFGPGGRVASRAFPAVEAPGGETVALTGVELEALAARHVEAWNLGSPEALAAVYSQGTTIRDDVEGTVWQGVPELAEEASGGPTVELGPAPGLFLYREGAHVEAIAIVQLGGDCPSLQARRWVLDGSRIVDEVRFAHVPSAQRCGAAGPVGWWDNFVLPPALQDNVTEIVDAGGQPIDLVNAEPDHTAYVTWLLDRFVASGIGLPHTRAIWFPPALECINGRGLAIESDDRYRGRHTAVLCVRADQLASDHTPSGWSEAAVVDGLHELAHLWMLDHLDDDIRRSFTERSGLEIWRGTVDEADWHERGVEHAATIIAWGLAGIDRTPHWMTPQPSCELLAARFELLTGHRPLTVCHGAGARP